MKIKIITTNSNHDFHIGLRKKKEEENLEPDDRKGNSDRPIEEY